MPLLLPSFRGFSRSSLMPFAIESLAHQVREEGPISPKDNDIREVGGYPHPHKCSLAFYFQVCLSSGVGPNVSMDAPDKHIPTPWAGPHPPSCCQGLGAP